MEPTAGTPDAIKQHVAAQYDQLAAGYDRIRFTRNCVERLIELADLRPGQRVLDVATGTGLVALIAAKQVGPAGEVVGIDISPEMLAQGTIKAEAAGLPNVHFNLGDAEHLDFTDRSFDVVLCASAIFFLPDPSSAVGEWVRVAAPGGTVLFSSWAPAFAELDNRFRGSLARYGIEQQVRANHGTADPSACRELLRAAGLVEADAHVDQLGYYFPTLDAYWEEMTITLYGLPVATLTPVQLAQFKSEHLQEMALLLTPQGLWRDVSTIFASGSKPSPYATTDPSQ
jgi:ubiquinone/menaquinone biosynthesis C-methylase UbiE